jgi:hypothetical protein
MVERAAKVCRRRRPRQRIGSGLALLLALAVLPLIAVPHAAAAQQTGRARSGVAVPVLPALSMTCPMHPDVVEAKAGACPLCKMNLVPVRLGIGWTCPLHAVVNEASAGSCRICGRALVEATVALTWTCRGEATGTHLEPGVCADGSPRIGQRTLRPHGNHNPKYGGQFFMAPDSWHHVEGTLPGARTFRLHIYDDYARALAPAKLKDVRARVVTRETFDPVTRTTTEIASAPLRVARDGALEARIDNTKVPASMTAKVRFKSDAPEYRFDFTFPALSVAPLTKESAARAGTASPGTANPGAARPVATPPVRGASANGAAGGASAAPTDGTAAGQRSAAAGTDVPGSTPTLNAATQPSAAGLSNTAELQPLVPVPVPETLGEILSQLRTRHTQVGALVASGEFGSVWVPAFQARDLAIALESHLAQIGAGARDLAEPALQEVVRAAWRLDSVGDLGNRQQVEEASARFSAAVTAVLTAFEGLR